jgi:hypothetical protein
MDLGCLVEHLARTVKTLRYLGESDEGIVRGVLSEMVYCGGPSIDQLARMIRDVKHPVFDDPRTISGAVTPDNIVLFERRRKVQGD